MSWVYLLIGIFLDVVGTVFLKLSNGLSRHWATALMMLCYLGSLLPMSLAARDMPVSLFYAAWSAAGTALIAVVGIVYFDEKATASRLISFGLIIAGLLLLNFSRQAG